MDFLRLVITEKCEVKNFEIGQIMTRLPDIFVFQPVYFRFWTQEGSISGPSVLYKITAIFM